MQVFYTVYNETMSIQDEKQKIERKLNGMDKEMQNLKERTSKLNETMKKPNSELNELMSKNEKLSMDNMEKFNLVSQARDEQQQCFMQVLTIVDEVLKGNDKSFKQLAHLRELFVFERNLNNELVEEIE